MMTEVSREVKTEVSREFATKHDMKNFMARIELDLRECNVAVPETAAPTNQKDPQCLHSGASMSRQLALYG